MKPIFQLSGAEGQVNLSHSVLADWGSREQFVGTVNAEYGPLLAAAPDLLAACQLYARAEAEWKADTRNIATFGEWMDRFKVSEAIDTALAKVRDR